jgi:hypothetical protein
VPGQDMAAATATVDAVPAEAANDSGPDGSGRLRRFFGGS